MVQGGAPVLLRLLLVVAFLQVGTFTLSLAHDVPEEILDGNTLQRFVDPLPLPKVVNGYEGTFEDAKPKRLAMGMWKIKQRLHRDLPEAHLFAYGESEAEASWPGPLIVAKRFVPLKVDWENNLPHSHILSQSIDKTILGGQKGVNLPPHHTGVPTVPHLHGGENPAHSDGHPNAWFTNKELCNRTDSFPYCTGHTFQGQKYDYPNTQMASTYFYHDHTHGLARLNVYAGLVGGYVVLDPAVEEGLGLPSGINEFDIPLLISDRTLTKNGQLYYSVTDEPTKFHPKWAPEFFGDIIVVNGKAWPYLEVQPCMYRFRIIEASSSRFFSFDMRVEGDNSSAPSLPPVYIIGTDGGYLDKPYMKTSFLMAPGQRRDILVDFSSTAVGTKLIVLANKAATPFPDGDPVAGQAASVMEFRVVAKDPTTASKCLAGPPPAKLLGSLPHLGKTAVIRPLLLIENADSADHVIGSAINNISYSSVATELPVVGTTESWDYINTTPDAHPIHIHLVHGRVAFRRTYDVERFMAQLCHVDGIVPVEGKPVSAHDLGRHDLPSCYTAPWELPEEEEKGLQDTVVVPPASVLRFKIQFSSQSPRPQRDSVEDYPFDATQFPGYVYHCHIIDHEENDMMRPFLLTPVPSRDRYVVRSFPAII